jgi:hypothetical protein
MPGDDYMGDHDHGSYRDGPCPGCERERAEAAGGRRKVCPATEQPCEHHGCVVQGEGVCWATGARRPVPTASEGKVRVFTENDVLTLLTDALGRGEFGPGYDDDDARRVAAAKMVEAHKSELTEEVIARSQVDRLVALALVWGAWDYEGLPDAVWDRLYEDKLLREASDQSGERWPVLTSEGEAFLRAELERDR